MKIKKVWGIFAVVCVLAMTIGVTLPASAQMSEVKEKPPMYSYVSSWAVPRAQWAEMDKADAADEPMFEKALASGALVGYGRDVNLVHQPDGYTSDEWFSAMSMGALVSVLEGLYKSGSPVTPVLSAATKHEDGMFESRYYNWHSGSWKNGYTHVSSYKLKADAPDEAVGMLSKNFIAPLLEKLVADGTLHEYEIDTEAIHTQSPGTFWIVYIAASPEGLDKVNAALEAALKASPFAGPAFGSMVDFTPHRDQLARTNGTFK